MGMFGRGRTRATRPQSWFLYPKEWNMSTVVNYILPCRHAYTISIGSWSSEPVGQPPSRSPKLELTHPLDDVNALIDGQKYIKMVIPAIVNLVYKKLLKYDVTARVFSNRDSRNEENPGRFVKEDGNVIQNRKIFLRWYLTKLNSDPTKMEYWEYLDKVG